MPLKKKNNSAWLKLAFFCALLLPVLVPAAAHAYNFSYPTIIGSDNDVCPGPGLTRRLMLCIKENIVSGTNDFLIPFSNYMAATVGVACTLAVALWGAGAASGKHEAMTRDMFVLAIKIGCVIVFCFNFGGLFPAMLDIMDEMIGFVGGYLLNITAMYNPNCLNFNDPLSLQIWDSIDCLVDTLIGNIYSSFSLSLGLVGFLFASLFSSGIGFFIAMLGLYIIAQCLFAIARALYVFIGAYIGFSIMVVISPIFIPMILFAATKGYFDKWLRITSSFVLQPFVMVLGFGMLIAGEEQAIFTAPFSVTHAIAGADADIPGFNLGGWANAVGAYGTKGQLGKAVQIDPKKEMQVLGMPQDTDTGALGVIGEHVGATAQMWQNNIFDYMGIGDNGLSDLRFFKVDLPTTAVDWDWLAAYYDQNNGDDTNEEFTSGYIVRVLLSFGLAAITTYILVTMLGTLPFISATLLGEGPGIGLQDIAPPGTSVMNSLQDKMAKAFKGGPAKGGK